MPCGCSKVHFLFLGLIDAPCSCRYLYRLNAIEAGLASQIEALAMKEPKKW